MRPCLLHLSQRFSKTSLSCLNWRRVCREVWKVSVVGIVSTLCCRKTMENQAMVLSTLCSGSHKHGLSDQPSNTPCRVGLSFPFLQSKHQHFHMNYYLFSLWSTCRNSYIWLLHKNCNLNMVFLWAAHKWLLWNVNYVVLVYFYIMEYSVVTSSDANICIAAVFFPHWEHCHEFVAMQNILKDKIPL